ncbi:MAG: flippase-like domain-containing protein [Candidatus Omnitrophica bacterium]|nr:flippase-like domain-containing protein [Candidatus Omnitrophota bacterium]
MENKRVLLVNCIGIALITVLILGGLFLKIDIEKFWAEISSISPIHLLIALVLSIIANIILVADRWRRILKLLGCSLTLREATFVVLACKPVKFLLPLRLGSLCKVVYIKRYMQFGRGLSSIFLDNIFDKISILSLLCLGAIFYKTHSLWVIILMFFAITFLFLYSEAFVSLFWPWLEKKESKLYVFIRQALSGLKEIPMMPKVKLLAYSVFIKLLSLIIFYFIFKGFGMEIGIYKFFAFMPVVSILSEVPFTLAGLGIREASVLFLFLGSAPEEKLLSAGVMLSFVEKLFPALIGLLVFIPFIKLLNGKKWIN